jgi:hypothetical protein
MVPRAIAHQSGTAVVIAALTHLLGGRDLNLTTISVDGTLSKGFGVGGLAHIAPYLGWTVLMVAASTRVIDPTPEDSADVERNFVFPDLSPTDNLHHRLTLGVRVLVLPHVLALPRLQMGPAWCSTCPRRQLRATPGNPRIRG